MLSVPADVDPALAADVDALVAEHGSGRDSLLPILQELKRRHGRISDPAMQLVADRLGIPPVEVLGVVSFYSFLDGTQGRHVVRVCRTISCELAGARAIGARLERELGVPMGDTTPDGAVTAAWVHCIGLCDVAPAVLVDDAASGHLTPDRAAALVAALRVDDGVGSASGDDRRP